MTIVRYTAGRIIGLAGAVRPLRLHEERVSSVMMCIVDRVALLREMEKLSRGGTTQLGGRMDQLWHLLQESHYARSGLYLWSGLLYQQLQHSFSWLKLLC
jgi:hypothetical protein